MADIQNIKKPTNLPPITLAELNNYTEGNKDTYINQPKPFGINDGLIVNICADSINPNYIYYLKSSEFEMIGYIHTINRKRMIFLPFYRRDRHSSPWEVYIINYELDKKDFNSVDEIKALGLNKNPDFEEEQERKYRETMVNEENIEAIKKQPKGTLDDAEEQPKKSVIITRPQNMLNYQILLVGRITKLKSNRRKNNNSSCNRRKNNPKQSVIITTTQVSKWHRKTKIESKHDLRR